MLLLPARFRYDYMAADPRWAARLLLLEVLLQAAVNNARHLLFAIFFVLAGCD